MTYERLSPDDSRLARVFAEFDCAPPENGFVLAGFEDGRLACFQCFHQVNHAGPVWIAPEHRGQGLWSPLQQEMEKVLEPGTYYYQFGTEANMSQLQRMNLEPLGWTVWGRRV